MVCVSGINGGRMRLYIAYNTRRLHWRVLRQVRAGKGDAFYAFLGWDIGRQTR